MKRQGKTFSIGERFIHDNSEDEYLLATTDGGFSAILVNLRSGFRRVGAVRLRKPFQITPKEFNKIAGGEADNFTKIETDK